MKGFVIFLYYFIVHILCLIESSSVRERISNVLKKPNRESEVMYFHDTDYPRANETSRKLHQKLWDEYYSCLNHTLSQISSNRIIHPAALIVLEGASITLDCEICFSPMEKFTEDTIKWYFNPDDDILSHTLITQSRTIQISQKDGSLTLYNVNRKESGRYWCRIEDAYSKYYYVSVDTDIDAVKIVHTNNAANGPYEIEEKHLPLFNIKIYSSWGKWSTCSTCNSVGRKFRYGYCTISMEEHEDLLHDIEKKSVEETDDTDYKDIDKTTITLTESTEFHANVEDSYIDVNLIDQMRRILLIFNNKVPCKFKYLPLKIKNIQSIANFSTQKMIRYCKMKCRRNVIFELRDRQGNIIESANNSAGIYSIVQGTPMLTPFTSHSTLYEKSGRNTSLICPGALDTNTPITWKKGNITLNEYTRKLIGSTIKFNAEMHLVFEKLSTNDTDIYSCWQNNEIVGAVKLIVTEELELQMNQYIVFIGSILIIATFLRLFLKVFQNNQKPRIN